MQKLNKIYGQDIKFDESCLVNGILVDLRARTVSLGKTI